MCRFRYGREREREAGRSTQDERETDMKRNRTTHTRYVEELMEVEKRGERLGERLHRCIATERETGRDGETRMGTGRDSDSKRDRESWRDTDGDRER